MEGEYYKTKASVEEYIQLAKDVSGAQLIEKLKPFFNARIDSVGNWFRPRNGLEDFKRLL